VLIDEARAYAKRLRHDFPDARVFLYGSVARGDFNLSSDIDLLVVAAGLPAEPIERSRCLYRYTAGREEPKGFLPTEFARLQSKGKLWYLEGALEF
jgi:predicted nucleotidyltransferase